MRASILGSSLLLPVVLAGALGASACGDGTRPSVTPAADLGGGAIDAGTEPADLGAVGDDLGSAADLGSATDLGSAMDLGSVVSTAPDAVGPYAVTRTTATVSGTMVTVFDPALPSAVRAPVAIFMPGFQLTVSQYAAICERLASHGVVVVGVDATGGFSPNHVMLRDAAIAVLDWALTTAPSAAHSDGTRVLAFGHSLGGKLATMMAGAEVRVTALLAIDPVNGGGGPGMGYSTERPDVVPEVVAALTIPLGFLGETTNGTGGFMPCAPTAENFQTFYAAATTAPWAAQWDFTGADHMDFVPDTTGCFTCGFCGAGTADPAVVVRNTTTLVVAFAQRHLLGDASAEVWLTGASVPAGIVVMSRP